MSISTIKRVSYLILVAILFQYTSFANEQYGGIDSDSLVTKMINGSEQLASTGKEEAIYNVGNMTFYKDFSSSIKDKVASPSASLLADYSIGSPTGTFTSTRGASNPATYISDSSGTVTTTTTSNVPRFTYGFYNTTGFVSRPGLIIEGASTNLVPKSSLFNDATWTASNVTASDAEALASPDGTATTSSITATNANGTLLLASAVTAQTFSIWLRRKTGTGNIDITANGGTGWTTVTLVAGKWARFQVTAASASQTCGVRVVTSGDAVYMWGGQFEALPFASSYIPTIGSALTRNTEILSYTILGNRTADTETIFCKVTPFWTGSQPASNYRFLSNDTKDRVLRLENSTDKIRFFPNTTDSATSVSTSTTTLVAFTSYVIVAGAISPTATTNSKIGIDAVSEATDTNDYTSPAWGTNFYVGGNSDGSLPEFGIMSSIVFYSRDLTFSSGDIATVTNIINL